MYRDSQQEYLAQQLLDSLRFSMVEIASECGNCKTHIIKTQSQVIQDFEAIRWDKCLNPHYQKLNIFIEKKRIFPAFPTLELNSNIPEEYGKISKGSSHT